MKRFIAIILCIFAFVGFSEEIMWWLVDESATVDGEVITSFLQPYPEDDNHWNAVRIKVTSGDNIIYLDNYQAWDGGHWTSSPGEEGVWIGDSGDGRGISTGEWTTQTPLVGLDHELFEAALFQVQLGTLTYDDVLDVVNWITLAETDPVAKATLTQHLYERGTIQPPGYSQWTPTEFYTHSSVPEPSSALLCIIGFGILLLKRKS